MSVQKDSSGKRWVSAEVEVLGTPEQVWQAIATGPGVSSWFVPTEKKEDGTVVSHFGPGMDAVAKETAWEPPHRFAAEGEMGPGGPKLATEWTVETRDGGKCLVRVVHSLFAATDDWDEQLENIERGWPDYFAILCLYIKHFAGRPSAIFQCMGVAPEPDRAAWEKLTHSLGLLEMSLALHVRSKGDAPRLSGIIERMGESGHPCQLLIRLDQPMDGIAHLFALAMGGQVFVSLRFYLYGEDAATMVKEQESIWNAWLQRHFVLPTGEIHC